MFFIECLLLTNYIGCNMDSTILETRKMLLLIAFVQNKLIKLVVSENQGEISAS